MALTKPGTEPAGSVEAWLLAARLGDTSAFGQAIETCRDYLMLVADRELDHKLKPKGSASDVVQETFLDAHCGFGQFQGQTEPELKSWLRRILRNNLLNMVRRYKQSKRRIAREVPLEVWTASAPAEQGLPARKDTPSRHAIHEEEAQLLARSLERLPEVPRQVITWRHQEYCSFEEIGARLGVSADAARMSWARAVRRLQRELDGTGGKAAPGDAGDVR